MHKVLHVLHHKKYFSDTSSGAATAVNSSSNGSVYAFIIYGICGCGGGIVVGSLWLIEEECEFVRCSVHCLRFLSVAVRLGGREVCRVHARSSRVTSEIIGVRMCENVRPSNEGHGAVALNLTFVVPLSVT